MDRFHVSVIIASKYQQQNNFQFSLSLYKLIMNIIIKSQWSPLVQSLRYFASKMQASSTQNTKDSAGRRLGIKKYGGEEVMPGDIIVRQRGFKWKSGKNVIVGKDQTIHAKVEGIVHFRES